MISFLQVIICPFLIIPSFLGRYISEIIHIFLPIKAVSYQFGQTNHKKVSFFSVHIIHFYWYGQRNCKKKLFFSVHVIDLYCFGQKIYKKKPLFSAHVIHSHLFGQENIIIPRSKELGQSNFHIESFTLFTVLVPATCLWYFS